MPDHSFSKEIFPHIQAEPALRQPEAIRSRPIAGYWGAETNPRLTPTSRQGAAEGSQVSPQGTEGLPDVSDFGSTSCFPVAARRSRVKAAWPASSRCALAPALSRAVQKGVSSRPGLAGCRGSSPLAPLPPCSASHFLFCFVGCQKEIRQGDGEVLWCPREALKLVF